MLQLLRSLDPFSSLDLPALHTVERHATRIDLPAGRRLRQSGKSLSGRYYLLRGKLKDLNSATVVSPNARPVLATDDYVSTRSSAASLASMITLTPAQLLHVDIEPISFLLESAALLQSAAELPEPGEFEEDSWQVRFLRSHMLAPLSPGHWQKILGALQACEFEAGEWVFRTGDDAQQCFILAHGDARIVRHRELLRTLKPGDFFGEDALLSGAGRNACVQVCSDSTLMLLDAAVFHGWLADLLIAGEDLETPHSNQQHCLLRVDSSLDLRSRLQNLDPCICYRVQGEARAMRLAVFLLRQRGIRARLV